MLRVLVEAESLRALENCGVQALLEGFLVRIFDHIELVIARVCRRQSVVFAEGLVDLESLRTINAFKCLEAIKGYLGRARAKHEETRHVFLAHLVHNLPEPLNHGSVRLVAVVLGIRTEIVQVDCRETRNQKFQLFLIEDADHVPRNKLIEAFEEGGSRVSFIIGGAEGLPPSLKASSELLSLSRMTLTHQMARLFLAEQIYRAAEIRRGSPYHK